MRGKHICLYHFSRYISISNPLSSLNTARQRRRARLQEEILQHDIEWYIYLYRLMVILAWLTTLLFSSPQAVIFRVMKHPQADFTQCTTWNFFESFASNVTVGNTTQLLLPGGMTPTAAADLYHTLFNCEVKFYFSKITQFQNKKIDQFDFWYQDQSGNKI